MCQVMSRAQLEEERMESLTLFQRASESVGFSRMLRQGLVMLHSIDRSPDSDPSSLVSTIRSLNRFADQFVAMEMEQARAGAGSCAFHAVSCSFVCFSCSFMQSRVFFMQFHAVSCGFHALSCSFLCFSCTFMQFPVFFMHFHALSCVFHAVSCFSGAVSCVCLL